jgi:hypothetical protein
VLLQPLAIESSLEVYGRDGSRFDSGLLRGILKWQTSWRRMLPTLLSTLLSRLSELSFQLSSR